MNWRSSASDELHSLVRLMQSDGCVSPSGHQVQENKQVPVMLTHTHTLSKTKAKEINSAYLKLGERKYSIKK